MKKADEYASLSPSGEFVWQRAKKVIKKRYKGVLLHFNTKGNDFLVTPDHRMYGRRTYNAMGRYKPGGLEFMFAKDVAKLQRTNNAMPFQVPLAADTWNGTLPERGTRVRLKADWEGVGCKPLDYNLDLLDYVSLLGIFLAEGHTSGTMHGMDRHGGAPLVEQAIKAESSGVRSTWKPRTNRGYHVSISQVPHSKHYNEIEELMSRLPFQIRYHNGGFDCTCKALWKELHPLGNKYTKRIPAWVKDLPVEYLRELIRWMVMGDGHTPQLQHETKQDGGPEKAFQYDTASKRLADDVTEILQKLGWGAYIYTLKGDPHKQHHDKQVHGTSDFYCVKVAKQKWTGIGEPTSVDYDGYVYCPAVPPNGTVLVRRNGKIAWCGQTPYNLRRMSRTPVPRRAINLIKGALIAQPWDIRPVEDTDPIDNESQDDQKERSHIGKTIFTHPNHSDSFQSFVEQGVEDMCILGAFCGELRLTLDPERPLKMWPVNVESIRIFPAWSESTLDMPRYAQMTGLKGERGAVLFYDDEMLYVKDNPSTDNPFGLGKMEVAFMSVNSFLGVQDMAGRAGADQVHKTWLWWEQPQSDSAYQIVRRHIQNEMEGQAKVSIIGGMKKPDVVEITPVNEQDLLLNWQEMLIRMIANGFDMSAMALGIEHDINRAVGEVLDDKDFRSAVVPMAKRLQEAFTRKILHDKLGWYDLEFIFLNLDDPDAQTKIDMYARMYSTNAITPAEIRRGMNLKPRNPELHPFDDLTQFECMLLNIQAMEDSQNNLADSGVNRQLQVQQIQNKLNPPQQAQPLAPGQPTKPGQQTAPGPSKPQQQAPQSQGLEKITPGSVSKGGQPPNMKPLSLPKFPIVSSIDGKSYTAKKLQQLPLNEMADVWNFSQMSASQFLLAMDQQEAGILEKLTEEVKEFFDQQLQQEANKPKHKIPPALIKKWAKALGIKVRQQDKRTSDFGQWLYKLGQRPGRPGGGSSPKSNAGKPGDINKITRV
jgi:hypothetical protein